MAEANNQLRTARERTASPTHADAGLSRQELAELVNTWVWEHHNKTVVITAHYVGRLETGIIRWPGALYREALRAILGAPTDAALGFVNARSRRAAVKLENVDRQQLLRTTTALGVGTLILGPLAALLEGSSEPTPIPKRVGATEIEQIRAAAKVFESWSFTYGGGLARETVFAQSRWSAGFLEATCPARLRPELYYAVGDLADVAGYMAYDADAELASLTMATGDPLQAVTIETRPCTPPAPSAPAAPPTACGNSVGTPPRTSSSMRSRTCGTGSPPFWCGPIARRVSGNPSRSVLDMYVIT